MGGFIVDGNGVQVMFTQNVDFSGSPAPSAQILSDGQLIIGSSSSPNMRVNNLSAGSGINIVNGNGTIMISATAANPTVLNSFIPSTSAVSLTNATPTNVTSLTLSSGTYLISGIVNLTGTITVALSGQIASISTVSSTNGTQGNNACSYGIASAAFLLGDVSLTVPSYPLTIATTTTVYLVAQVGFSLGTCKAYGRLTALKIA